LAAVRGVQRLKVLGKEGPGPPPVVGPSSLETINAGAAGPNRGQSGRGAVGDTLPDGWFVFVFWNLLPYDSPEAIRGSTDTPRRSGIDKSNRTPGPRKLADRPGRQKLPPARPADSGEPGSPRDSWILAPLTPPDHPAVCGGARRSPAGFAFHSVLWWWGPLGSTSKWPFLGSLGWCLRKTAGKLFFFAKP